MHLRSPLPPNITSPCHHPLPFPLPSPSHRAAANHYLPTTPPSPALAEPELDPLSEPQPAEVDLAPGKPGLTPLPFSPQTWQSFALTSLPNATVARIIFDLGARDGELFARQTGLAQAAAEMQLALAR